MRADQVIEMAGGVAGASASGPVAQVRSSDASSPPDSGAGAGPSLDHLVCSQQEGLWHGQAEGLGGLEVDHQFELGRLLDRQIAWFGTPLRILST